MWLTAARQRAVKPQEFLPAPIPSNGLGLVRMWVTETTTDDSGSVVDVSGVVVSGLDRRSLHMTTVREG